MGTSCDKNTIDDNNGHNHSLACEHTALQNPNGGIVYIQDGKIHEVCDNGHTHKAQICLTHEFTIVADPDTDCTKIDDCHLVIQKNGTAEIHHNDSGKGRCTVVAKLTVLNP